MNTISEKIATGEEYKKKGNSFYSEQQFKKALSSYHFAHLYLKGLDNAPLKGIVPEGENEISQELKAKIKLLQVQTFSNMAACYLKTDQYDKAIEFCDKVIQLDSTNPKAYYRKGQAYAALKDIYKAADMYKAAAKLSPQDFGIRRDLKSCTEEIELLEKESKEALRKNLQKSLSK